MASRQETTHHVTVYDFRDTELMAKLNEQGASGATAVDIAESLGMSGGDGTRAVGMRMAWMRKYGMVEYDEKHHLWVLSKGGERVMESQMRAAMTKVIEAVPDESMVDVMAHVTSRYRLGDPMVAHLLRREFLYGTSPRSAIWTRR